METTHDSVMLTESGTWIICGQQVKRPCLPIFRDFSYMYIETLLPKLLDGGTGRHRASYLFDLPNWRR